MKHSTFGIAMKMLFAKKQRLLLTCIGIAISFGLIIVISTLFVSMEQSVQKTIEKELGSSELRVGYNPYRGEDSKKFLTKEEIDKLKKLDGVINTSATIVFPEIATNTVDIETRELDSIVYLGIEPSELISNYIGFTIALHPDEIVITEAVAKHWGVRLGDTKEFAINKDTMLTKRIGEIIPDDLVELTVLVHIDVIREAYGLGEVANNIFVDIEDGRSDHGMEKMIRSEIDENIDVALLSQNKSVLKQRGMFRFLAIGLGSILLLVSVLFLSSSFKMMLLGRVRELSTFRMIGASKRVIYKMVMMEAAVLNLLGVLLGVGVGVLFVTIAGQFIDSMMGVVVQNVTIDWQLIMMIAGIGWLLLTLSVMRVAKTSGDTAPLVAVRQSEQEKLSKSSAWFAGGFIVIGITLLWLGLSGKMAGDTAPLLMLLGGLITAAGCLLGTGYMIPIIARNSGAVLRKFSIPESYYARKQFVALRKQNTFIVMLLASIVTALIVIPTFIDNLNQNMVKEAVRKHITPIVIEQKRGVMSPSIVDEVREVEGVAYALPMSQNSGVLLGEMDYSQADPKWLEKNSVRLESNKGLSLYEETYAYEWTRIVQTDIKLMQQMGLLQGTSEQLASGMIIQPQYARQMGVTQGDTISLQEYSSGENGRKPGDRLDQYKITISGIKELSFLPTPDSLLVDYKHPGVGWISKEENSASNTLSAQRIYVQIAEGANIADVRAALQQIFDNNRMVKITDLDSELQIIANGLKEQRTILWSVMVVFIVVGIVGVINTFGATFHAHRREYAILRAIRLTIAKLRSVLVVQGLLYATTAIVVGMIASIWIIIGIFNVDEAVSSWSINWFTVALPIIIVGAIGVIVSLIYARQLGQKPITDELTVE
ncbi:FtsX-like permease family protein [Paenibacillus yanchengensis]|uniref:FtsX-like permease family protein n=1 Tax=Paenibacillus yanchengensis TaxID=2035833 RepID=A0ABW4YPS1_9BACL